jgi:hypothetical protein
MPMLYHSEPNRAEPARWIWFSVETPSTFREYKLPSSEAEWSWDDRRNYRELETLAERCGKPVHRSAHLQAAATS